MSTFFVCGEGTVFENNMFETYMLENKKGRKLSALFTWEKVC